MVNLYIEHRMITKDPLLYFFQDGQMMQVPCKVFVGRCTEDLQQDDLREYFSKFGEVTDVFIPKPFRAFAFVTFLDPEIAMGLCGEDHIIKGISVHVSEAAPKSELNGGRSYGGNRGGGGGRDQHMGRPLGGNHYQQHHHGGGNMGQGVWSQGGHNRGSIDMPNLQALGITGQAGNGAQGQGQNMNNPLSMGALNLGMPMNTALMAAALNQAGWGLIGSLQGNQAQPAGDQGQQGFVGPNQGGAGFGGGPPGGPQQAGGPPGGAGAGAGGFLSWMSQGGGGGGGAGDAGQGGGGQGSNGPQQQGSWSQRDNNKQNYLKYDV